MYYTRLLGDNRNSSKTSSTSSTWRKKNIMILPLLPLKAVAFPQNSDLHILGIPSGDELHSMLNKYSLPSSSLACGLPCPTFIGDDGRIELSYSVNFFVGDQPIIQREMEGSDEGEVGLKEVKDILLLLAKQMVELKAAMSQREEIASRSSEYPLGSLPGSETKSGAGRELVGGITPFRPFREAR